MQLEKNPIKESDYKIKMFLRKMHLPKLKVTLAIHVNLKHEKKNGNMNLPGLL